MLSNHGTMNRFLSSRTLTVAIVSSVVLINSVAWGIPLLVKSGQPGALLDGSKVTTDALPRSSGSVEKRLEIKAAKIALDADRALIPLPAKAPMREEAQAVLQSREPATMFPRPQAAPVLLLQASQEATAPDRDGAVKRGRGVVLERHAARDIVLVSPYTPGVRVAPDGRGHEWRHRNLRISSGPTTYDRAKAIARRAAQRFEQMRDRMAKLNVRDAGSTNAERVRRLALLPVAPRPPRIVTGSIGRRATKSASNYIRSRLVRRPIGHSIARLPRNFSPAFVMSVAPAPAMSSGAPTVNSGKRVAQPRRVARLTTTATIRTQRKRARSRAVRSRRNAARTRRLRVKRNRATARRRITRRTVRRSRRPARRINGFRRGFHRQLVAANFFGNRD